MVEPAKQEASAGPHPTVDDVEFRALYRKSEYVVETSDGWALFITRYRPVRQRFEQPLFGEPMLLVHGFSQNRHAWTSGEFVKNLLFFGMDIHILELRGHGKSSVQAQEARCARLGRKRPADLNYEWDIDSYFLYDVPAAVTAVRRVTRRERIFYCGHSMGGMLGYGYAGIHEHFEGMVTIGSAADLGKGAPVLRAMARLSPLVNLAIDGTLEAVNLQRSARHALQELAAGVFRQRAPAVPAPLEYRYLPIDAWLRAASTGLGYAEESPLVAFVANRVNYLARWDRLAMENMRWLLREGGEREPRRVVDQFFRWIRSGETICYRTGYDYKRGFEKIRVPMAIIFGDLDPLASLRSTRTVYRAARSEYLLWRPVKGNSHIELTMGHDIRQICYDIKNLVEYARGHRGRSPSLPRRA